MQSKSDGPKRDEESFVCVGDIEWGYFHYGLFPPFSSPTVRVDRIANFLGILLFLFFRLVHNGLLRFISGSKWK